MKFLLPLSLRRTIGGWWHDRRVRSKKNALLQSLAGTGAACNVCAWEGRAFADDHWHLNSVCPVCGSQVRHRMLAALFNGWAPGFDEATLLRGKEILHFAPERQLRERVRKAAARHVTADFDRGDCDLRLDMGAMPMVPDAGFDVVIACDVLEHVPDDRAAFRELRRILRPGGLAILTVPQVDPPSQTDEDPAVTDTFERERRFGQKDHVRMYGEDFCLRLETSGSRSRRSVQRAFLLKKFSVIDLPRSGRARAHLPPIFSASTSAPPQPPGARQCRPHRREDFFRVGKACRGSGRAIRLRCSCRGCLDRAGGHRKCRAGLR